MYLGAMIWSPDDEKKKKALEKTKKKKASDKEKKKKALDKGKKKQLSNKEKAKQSSGNDRARDEDSPFSNVDPEKPVLEALSTESSTFVLKPWQVTRVA